eukprot:353253_1
MNILLSFFIILAVDVDCSKPIWNIAHMVNHRDQIDEFLNLGANAIEVDVQYSPDGTIGIILNAGTNVAFLAELWHGVPCDIGRDCERFDYIGPYLEEIRARATDGNSKYNPKLGLIYFDNKLENGDDYHKAGQNLATEVIKLFPSKIYVMVGVPYTSQKSFFEGFYNKIESDAQNVQYLDRIGYEFSDEKYTDPDTLQQIFIDIGVNTHNALSVWLSKGIYNGLATDYDFTNFLQARDDPGPVSKVYGWTADREKTMQKWMYKGLDAVITNQPQNLVSVLNYPSLKYKLHLATNADRPFTYISTPTKYHGCSIWFSYSYCWQTCGKYPGPNDWCWVEGAIYCGKDPYICQILDQKGCYYGETCT